MNQTQVTEMLALLRESVQLQKQILERLDRTAPQRAAQDYVDWAKWREDSSWNFQISG
jgi:hypothetical protein